MLLHLVSTLPMPELSNGSPALYDIVAPPSLDCPGVEDNPACGTCFVQLRPACVVAPYVISIGVMVVLV